MQPTLIVLAAGMGSRYGGLKQLDSVGPNGETIMDYSVFDAARAGFGKVVFIIRNYFRTDFEALFAHRYGDAIEVAFVAQEPEKELPPEFTVPPSRTKPWGTAHAMLMAAPQTHTPFAVINADDFYGREAYEALAHFLCNNFSQTCPVNNHYAMVGYQICNTLSEAGGVSRGICSVNQQNMLTGVVERHRIRTETSGEIVYENNLGALSEVSPNTLVSMNCWGFTPDFFSHIRCAFHTFIHERGDDIGAEFYIPFAVNQLIKDQKASVEVLRTDAQWFGITFPEDRPYAQAQISKLIANGVYPKSIIHK